jgi:hypothetical protein
MDFYNRKEFSGTTFARPFRGYQVYTSTDAESTLAEIRAYVSSNDLSDEYGEGEGTPAVIYATKNLATLLLADIASIQALGCDGKLMTKTIIQPPSPPKP